MSKPSEKAMQVALHIEDNCLDLAQTAAAINAALTEALKERDKVIVMAEEVLRAILAEQAGWAEVEQAHNTLAAIAKLKGEG
jgi:hypothetical protein